MNGKSYIFRINDNGEGLQIVRNVFLERGWVEYDENLHGEMEWNVWWKTSRFRTSEYESLKPWQRLNHYPKSSSITRKDCLARNLKRMKGVYGPSVYNFCPLSFNVPNDYTKFVAEYTKLQQKSDSRALLWICKPTDMSRGRGIFIFKDLSELQYNCSAVVQRYVMNPMLISGYKFDLRLYVAVPSFHPLNIYVHEESIVRFSTEKYNLSTLNNVFSHLTNSSINKFSPNYSAGKERVGPGCKWTLSQLRYYFHQNSVDDRLLWQRIINIIVLTLITQSPLVPKVDNCFELYGFDILVDEDKKPWLLEVNFSPSLSADCHTDYVVKKPVIHDLMEMLNLKEADLDHGKTTPATNRQSPGGSRRSYSRVSQSGSVKHLPSVRSGKKSAPNTPSPSPSPAPPPPPIFGLPLVHQEDSNSNQAAGDGNDSTRVASSKRTKSRTSDTLSLDSPCDDRVLFLPPRSPRSKCLRKANSKTSNVSDSGVSSFSGSSDLSCGTPVREIAERRSARLKSRQQTESRNAKSLCDLGSRDQKLTESSVNDWRFMVRKPNLATETDVRDENKEKITHHKHKTTRRKTKLSVSDVSQVTPNHFKKRHSIASTKPWQPLQRGRVIGGRQSGVKGPSERYGGFYLVFPFNEVTLRASQTSLDARVITREIQKQLREIASNDGCHDNRDRLWAPIRSSDSPKPF